MIIPAVPPVGFVIAYEYLWYSQAGSREDGVKTYPAAIILSVDSGAGGMIAYAVGISHKPPTAEERAVEVPLRLARHLGLDLEACWVYTDQLNVFSWPGPDLRLASRLSTRPAAVGTCVIGQLPSDWFETVKADVLECRELGLLKASKRTS